MTAFADTIRNLASTATPGASTQDIMDPSVVAARRRAAARMADGISQTFLTSSRGLQAPAGVGLKPPGDDEIGLIPTLTDEEFQKRWNGARLGAGLGATPGAIPGTYSTPAPAGASGQATVAAVTKAADANKGYLANKIDKLDRQERVRPNSRYDFLFI